MQVFNESMENARAAIISIFEKERRNEDKDGNLRKKPTEYEELIMELWNYCDTQSVQTIESVIIEFEGTLVGYQIRLKDAANQFNHTDEEKINLKTKVSKFKSYRTQLEDYLKARLETGEMEA